MLRVNVFFLQSVLLSPLHCSASNSTQPMLPNLQHPNLFATVTRRQLKLLLRHRRPLRYLLLALRQVQLTAPRTRRSLHRRPLPPTINEAGLYSDFWNLLAVQVYFRVDTLKELIEIVDSRNIIAFIKDINFYHHI